MIALNNTILAGNSGGSPDCEGTLTSLGHNLIGKNTSCVVASAAGDQIGTIANPRDPKLGQLRNNGGPTLTHALLAGSPAIDAGANCLAADQRGVVRPQDGNGDGTSACDIGAFEIGAVSPATPSATSSGTPSTATPGQTHGSRILLPLARRSFTPTPTLTPAPTASPTPTTEPPLPCGEREPNEGPQNANPYPSNKSGSADEAFTYTVGAQGRYHVQVFAWEKQSTIHSYVLRVGN